MHLERSENNSGRVILIINFENAKVRMKHNGVKDITTLSFDGNDKISTLFEGIDSHRRAMVVLRDKTGEHSPEVPSNFS